MLAALDNAGILAYVALGSNLGDRHGALRGALAALRRHPEISVLRLSPVYESPAHTLTQGEVQPAFLNAVVELTTSLPPKGLLVFGHTLERRAGRRPGERRWAPRPLDVDILLYGALSCRERWIHLPHPRIAERRFVLQPLTDLAPDLHVPAPFDATVADLLTVCPDEGTVRRVPSNRVDPWISP